MPLNDLDLGDIDLNGYDSRHSKDFHTAHKELWIKLTLQHKEISISGEGLDANKDNDTGELTTKAVINIRANDSLNKNAREADLSEFSHWGFMPGAVKAYIVSETVICKLLWHVEDMNSDSKQTGKRLKAVETKTKAASDLELQMANLGIS